MKTHTPASLPLPQALKSMVNVEIVHGDVVATIQCTAASIVQCAAPRLFENGTECFHGSVIALRKTDSALVLEEVILPARYVTGITVATESEIPKLKEGARILPLKQRTFYPDDKATPRNAMPSERIRERLAELADDREQTALNAAIFSTLNLPDNGRKLI